MFLVLFFSFRLVLYNFFLLITPDFSCYSYFSHHNLFLLIMMFFYSSHRVSVHNTEFLCLYCVFLIAPCCYYHTVFSHLFQCSLPRDAFSINYQILFSFSFHLKLNTPQQITHSHSNNPPHRFQTHHPCPFFPSTFSMTHIKTPLSNTISPKRC